MTRKESTPAAQPAGMLADVESAAREYADQRGKLTGLMEALRRSLDDAQRAMLPMIRAQAAEAAASREALGGRIQAASSAFVRPRSRTYHGVKVGLQKSQPRAIYLHDADLVALIRMNYPHLFEQLVKVTEKPIQAALKQLPETEREVLGIEIEPGTDGVLIRPSDGGMDKAVDALLADAARLEGGAQ